MFDYICEKILSLSMKAVKALLLCFLCISPHARLVSCLHASSCSEKNAVMSIIARRAFETTSSAVLVTRYHSAENIFLYGDINRSLDVQSVTKAITGFITKSLAMRGKIKENERVQFPFSISGATRDVSLIQIMSHTSCLSDSPLVRSSSIKQYSTRDEAFSSFFLCMPGEKFGYNNIVSNIVPFVIEKRIHKKFEDYAQDYLLTPLGIDKVIWPTDKQGHAVAMSGLILSASNLDKIGYAMMSKAYGDDTTSVADSIMASYSKSQHLHEIISFFWWIPPSIHTPASKKTVDVLYAQGWGGQYLVVCPRQKVVAVRTRDNRCFSPGGNQFEDFVDLISRYCSLL